MAAVGSRADGSGCVPVGIESNFLLRLDESSN